MLWKNIESKLWEHRREDVVLEVMIFKLSNWADGSAGNQNMWNTVGRARFWIERGAGDRAVHVELKLPLHRACGNVQQAFELLCLTH